MSNDTKPTTPTPPQLSYVTREWHDIGPARVCELWVQCDWPHPRAVALPDGSQVVAPPGVQRSYLGLMFELDETQVQVRGRIRTGDGRLDISIAEE